MESLENLDISKKRLAIFDLDGTLIDSAGLWTSVDAKVIRALSGQSIPANVIFNQYVASNTDDDYHRLLQENYLGGRVSIDEIKAARTNVVTQFYKDVEYKEGAEETLLNLRKRGVKLALATNCPAEHLRFLIHENENIRAKAPIDKTFDSIWLPFDDVWTPKPFATKKPDPEIYKNILDHYKIAPKDACAFEDSKVGINAAARAGILDTINVVDKFSYEQQTEINKTARFRIESFSVFNEKCFQKDSK